MKEINYRIDVEIANLNPKEVLPGYSSGKPFVEIRVHKRVDRRFLYFFPCIAENLVGKYEVTNEADVMAWMGKADQKGKARYDFESYPKLADFIIDNKLEGCAVHLTRTTDY